MAASAVAGAAVADGDLLMARQRFQSAANLYEGAGHSFWADPDVGPGEGGERRDLSGGTFRETPDQ
jgi:hypothetical protein